MAESLNLPDMLNLKLAQERVESARRQVVIETQGLEILRLRISINYRLVAGDQLDAATGEITRRPPAPLDPKVP